MKEEEFRALGVTDLINEVQRSEENRCQRRCSADKREALVCEYEKPFKLPATVNCGYGTPVLEVHFPGAWERCVNELFRKRLHFSSERQTLGDDLIVSAVRLHTQDF